MKHFCIIVFILLISLLTVKTLIEKFFQGCTGLDERPCLEYPQCLWHIDRTRTDINGKCISRKDLPQFIRRDLWWDRMIRRYFSNPYNYFKNLYYRYRPSYFYTTHNNYPLDRYDYVTYKLL